MSRASGSFSTYFVVKIRLKKVFSHVDKINEININLIKNLRVSNKLINLQNVSFRCDEIRDFIITHCVKETFREYFNLQMARTSEFITKHVYWFKSFWFDCLTRI